MLPVVSVVLSVVPVVPVAPVPVPSVVAPIELPLAAAVTRRLRLRLGRLVRVVRLLLAVCLRVALQGFAGFGGNLAVAVGLRNRDVVVRFGAIFRRTVGRASTASACCSATFSLASCCASATSSRTSLADSCLLQPAVPRARPRTAAAMNTLLLAMSVSLRCGFAAPHCGRGATMLAARFGALPDKLVNYRETGSYGSLPLAHVAI